MANFAYSAINNAGKEIRGSLTASSREEALSLLKAKGMVPVQVQAGNALNTDVNLSVFQRKPKPKEMAVFCRQMVSLLSAGVTIVSALDMLSEQTENKMLSEALLGCKSKIEGGSSFHEAMQQYRVFPDIFVTMVRAGEDSGSMETSFIRMAERFEKDSKLKGMVKKATIYPIIVAIVAVVVIIVMMTFIVPKFQSILGQLGADLPALTKAVVAVSNFTKDNILLMIIAVVLLVIGIKYFRKSDTGQHIVDKILLKLPLFGKLISRTACSNVTRTMATLLGSGIPMIEALDITAGIMTNVYFKEALLEAKKDVMVGMLLSDSLARTGMFPPMVSHMAGIGEETGNLVGMFDRAADYYDQEVQQTTEQVTAAIEPLVIVLLAGIVGTIVISLILPMASMYSNMDNL